MSNYSKFIKEFKNLDKNVFSEILKKNINNVSEFNVDYEEENSRWRIEWDKNEYINSLGEKCKFYSNFIFVSPFENTFLFKGDLCKIDEDINNYIKSCPHYMKAFIEHFRKLKNEQEFLN